MKPECGCLGRPNNTVTCQSTGLTLSRNRNIVRIWSEWWMGRAGERKNAHKNRNYVQFFSLAISTKKYIFINNALERCSFFFRWIVFRFFHLLHSAQLDCWHRFRNEPSVPVGIFMRTAFGATRTLLLTRWEWYTRIVEASGILETNRFAGVCLYRKKVNECKRRASECRTGERVPSGELWEASIYDDGARTTVDTAEIRTHNATGDRIFCTSA